jgi:hypothetical protein
MAIGQSWLMLDLALAVASSRETLGSVRPVEGDVLYLAPDIGLHPDAPMARHDRMGLLWMLKASMSLLSQPQRECCQFYQKS